MPKHQRDLGLKRDDVEPVQRDYAADGASIIWARSARRSAACLRLNLEYWDDVAGRTRHFIEDIMRFLDNVLSAITSRAPSLRHGARAPMRPMRERSGWTGRDGASTRLLQAKRRRVRRRDGEVVEYADFPAHPCAGADEASMAPGGRAWGMSRRGRRAACHGAVSAASSRSRRRLRASASSRAARQRVCRAHPGEHLYAQDAERISFVGQATPILERLLIEKAKNSDRGVELDPGARADRCRHLDWS